jgi:hypothetical protein
VSTTATRLIRVDELGDSRVAVVATPHGDLAVGLSGDLRIYPIADLVDLDRPVAELDDTKRAWIDSVAEHRQVSTEGTAREVVRRLGQQLHPDFDESNYWVK